MTGAMWRVVREGITAVASRLPLWKTPSWLELQAHYVAETSNGAAEMKSESSPKAVESAEEGVPIKKRVITVIVGTIVFLGIMPTIFLLLGGWIDQVIEIQVARSVEIATASAGLLVGVMLFGSAAFVMWRDGEGTPAPTAPPRRLVVTGPYRFCRNPILLGEMFYFFGFSTLADSLVTGIFVFLLVIGSGLLVLLLVGEDKGLEDKFGDEYRKYRSKTPWLIPGFPR